MTVSPNKKSKDKRYRFDSDLIVSDRDVSLADVQDDEDAIDRLLINTGFDADLESEFEETRNVIIDELDLSGESQGPKKPTGNRKIEPELKSIDIKDESPVSSLLASIDSYAFNKDLSDVDEDNDDMEGGLDIKPTPLLADGVPVIPPIELDREAPLLLEEPISLTPIKPEKDPFVIHNTGNKVEDELEFKTAPLRVGDVPEIAPIELEKEGSLQWEDLIDLNPIEQESDPAVPDIEWSAERGAWDMDTVQQEQTIALERLLSEQESINRRQEQFLRNLAAKTKKATLLSYAALIVGAAAIVVAVSSAMKDADPQPAAADLTKPLSGEMEDASSVDQENFRPDSALKDVSNKPESPAPEIDAKKSGSLDSDSDQAGMMATDRHAMAMTQAPMQSGWYVNLISFKQRSDAVIQASEFIRKGIRAEIIEVTVNDAIWYRLRVGGFISKEQAAAYAEKIKKPMQLNSLWIASN